MTKHRVILRKITKTCKSLLRLSNKEVEYKYIGNLLANMPLDHLFSFLFILSLFVMVDLAFNIDWILKPVGDRDLHCVDQSIRGWK